MKKAIKAIGILVIACALLAGGYFAGQKVQVSSIVSAMPKHSALKPIESDAPEQSGMPNEAHGEKAEDAGMIAKTDASAVDNTWTVVQTTENTTDSEALTLYTSAQKDGDEFVWDDGQKWVLEISDGQGGYYTLYDKYVSNGSVYYDVMQKENGDRVINVYTMSGTGTTIIQYTRTENGFTERTVYNSGAVNRLFSTVPLYN